MKTIYLAGGCFWGTEKYFALVPGVLHTEVGYANGKTQNPTYEEVCHQDTGYAETVKVEYDPARIPLVRLIGLFFEVIDPTSLNRQGEDVGNQYRTGMYYTDEADVPVLRAAMAALQSGLDAPVAVETMSLESYYPAEEYHQKYLEKNPEGYCHIGPERFEIARRLEASGIE